MLFTWFFALAGKRFLTNCPTFLHCCDRATTVLNAFIFSIFASVPDFKHLLHIITSVQFNSSKMFVLVKNMLAVLKWLLANNACSFVDLLWRRTYLSKINMSKI